MNKILTNFDLPIRDGINLTKIERVGISSRSGMKSLIGFLTSIKDVDLIFLNNPSFSDFVLVYLASKLRPGLFICGFDLILKRPDGVYEKTIAFLKSIFLSSFDLILTIHKDTSCYEKEYRIRREVFQYIPFKANNYEMAGTIDILDKGYVVALGSSQRDYVTFCEALDATGLKGYVICSEMAAKKHNAKLPTKTYRNIEIVNEFVSKSNWIKYIAESTLVVVPILPNTYQPAGISVYLEAMLLHKPVIVTKGSSVNGILDSELAVLVLENSIVDLASNIENLYDNKAKRDKLAYNGHQYAMSLGGDSRLRADIANILMQCLPT